MTRCGVIESILVPTALSLPGPWRCIAKNSPKIEHQQAEDSSEETGLKMQPSVCDAAVLPSSLRGLRHLASCPRIANLAFNSL